MGIDGVKKRVSLEDWGNRGANEFEEEKIGFGLGYFGDFRLVFDPADSREILCLARSGDFSVRSLVVVGVGGGQASEEEPVEVANEYH